MLRVQVLEPSLILASYPIIVVGEMDLLPFQNHIPFDERSLEEEARTLKIKKEIHLPSLSHPRAIHLCIYIQSSQNKFLFNIGSFLQSSFYSFYRMRFFNYFLLQSKKTQNRISSLKQIVLSNLWSPFFICVRFNLMTLVQR